jgi:hypothetical protein
MVEMTITVGTPVPNNLYSAPATDYLERLKKSTARYTDPSVGNKPRTQVIRPNEQFTLQQAANSGNLVAPQQDIFSGIDDREDEIAKRGDIATETEQQKLNQRRSQYNSNMESSLESAGDLGEFGGDGAGSGLSEEQLGNARLIANVGRQRGLGENEIQIALMTALAESGLRNLNYGDRDSVGLFQQRTSQGWGSLQQIMDPTYSAGKFYDALSKSARGATPWQTAQNVQRSAFADGSNYAKQWALAQQAYRTLSGGGSVSRGATAGSPGLQSWIQAHNNRYLDYDNAYGAQCVDMYSYYTTGFVGGKPLPVGYAPEIYNNYDSSVYNRIGNNTSARMGDVAIWGRGPNTPLGHVAIVVGDNGNGTLRVLHSNATAAGSRGNSVISNISKSALYGYLRPKKLG